MSNKIVVVLLLTSCFTASMGAADSVPRFALDAVAPGAGPQAVDARLAYLSSWIREKAPECPADVTAVVAQRFLDEFKQQHPDKLDRLLTRDFPLVDYEALMLRLAGAQLTGSSHASAREALACRRVQALLSASAAMPVTAKDASEVLEKIKAISEVYHRRVLEGRMEDDDLLPLLRKVRQAAGPMPLATAVPGGEKTLNASDIVAEFARRNQSGSAMQKFTAYTVEGRLKPAMGEEQQLLFFRLRPDRFRLVVRQSGATRFVLGSDGAHYWQQSPGQQVQLLTRDAVGERSHLSEFAEPMFEGEGYDFERLPDGVAGDRKVYRLKVTRSDGSSYVAVIDRESFREIGRENPDKTVIRYSDFREVAGVTFAFREEMTDASGRKGVLQLNRLTPNPGLVQVFFEPPAEKDQSYFYLERLMAQVPASSAKSTP